MPISFFIGLTDLNYVFPINRWARSSAPKTAEDAETSLTIRKFPVHYPGHGDQLRRRPARNVRSEAGRVFRTALT
jgi:hypothetical protein